MERLRLTGLLIVLSFFLGLNKPVCLAEEARYAKIQISEPVYDFGTVSEGTIIQHEFKIENSGNGDLLIQNVAPACGCTTGKVEPELIVPKAKGKLSVKFDTTGFIGNKVKTIKLYSNDPLQSSSLLTLKGSIQADVEVEPRRIFLGQLDLDGKIAEQKSLKVTIKVADNSKTRLGAIKLRSSVITVTELESQPKLKVLELALAKDAPKGEVRDRLVVALENTSRSAINIPIFASVNGQVKLDRSIISFGVLEGRETLWRSQKIENRSNKPMQISDLQSSDSSVKVELVEIERGRIFVIKLGVDPALVKSDLKSVISFKTNVPGEEEQSFSAIGILPPRL